MYMYIHVYHTHTHTHTHTRTHTFLLISLPPSFPPSHLPSLPPSLLPPSLPPSLLTSLPVYSEGGIIDGRYSLDGGLDYVRVEPPFRDDGVSTAQELERCKKMILTPYLTFLKVVRAAL